MKKIFLFSNSFDDSFGGMEEHRKAFVSFFNNDLDYALCLMSNSEGVYNILINNDRISFFKIEELSDYIKSLIGKEDVFFFNDFRWINELEYLKRCFSFIKFILRSGGNDVLRAPVYTDDVSLTIRQNRIVDLINNNIDCLIVNSDYSYLVNRNIGINPLIMKKIRGGVDFLEINELILNKIKNRDQLDVIYKTKGKKIITLACRFVPFKGILEFLIQIKAKFNYDEWMLLIVGNGVLLREIKETLVKFFPDNYILIEGASHKDALKYISISDVVVNSSLYYKRFFGDEWFYHTETMGRTMIEAVSLNIPLVATNVGGTSELFFENNNQNIGLLVHDFYDFDDQIKKLKYNNSFIDYSEQYSWQSIFEKYKMIFSNKGKCVYCFDIDGTVFDSSANESYVCSELKNRGSGTVLILNTARKTYSEVEEFFKESDADYLIYNNGQNILSKKEVFFGDLYNIKRNHHFTDLDKIEMLYLEKFNSSTIERTHANCLSIQNSCEVEKFCKQIVENFSNVVMLKGTSLIKLLSSNNNKLQGFLFVLKNFLHEKIVTAGDATNDIPFVQIGNVKFASEQIAQHICGAVKTFSKEEDRVALIRRIYNE